MIALLNDQLLAAGKAPLGYLNPLLYSYGTQAFTDITEGINPGAICDGNSVRLLYELYCTRFFLMYGT